MNRSFLTRVIMRTVAVALPLTLATAFQSPASAVPSPVGDYATVTATVTRQVVPDECRNVVDRVYTLDLKGLGAEIEAQGYTTRLGDPVYTALAWSRSTRITGPGNFYGTGSGSISFPTSQFQAGLELCPDDFDGGEVLPGTYTIETTLTADTDYTALCSVTERCQYYDNVYKRVLTYNVDIEAEVNEACEAAKSKLNSVRAALKKAKAKADRKPTRENRANVKKLKRKVVNAKSRVQSVC